MKVSIVVPFYKHPELADTFMEQFFANTDFTAHEIELIAVEDASESPELVETLMRWHDQHSDVMQLIVRTENGGFPGATNTGIRAATGDYVICVSSDVNVLDPAWIDSLIAPQHSLKCVTGGQYIDFNSLTFVDTQMVPYIGGWCLCFSRTFLDELEELLKSDEVFKESFKPGYFEDVLVCFYAKYLLGYELVAPGHHYPQMDIHLSHTGGQTLNQQAFPVEIIAEKNRIAFMDIVRIALSKYGKTL